MFEQPGFQWSTLRVVACQEALMSQLSDRSEEATATSSVPLVSSVSCKQQKKTRWGCCALPSCTGRAFRPIMGSRGPFLVCSRRNCQGKRDLTEAEWKTLPKRWLELWPVSWCKVSVRRRPKRPVANLRSGRKRFPWSRKKPPKHGVIRKRPASRKAPHQKTKKGFL